MMAVTFAENDCPEAALGYLVDDPGSACARGCGKDEVAGGGRLRTAPAGADHCH
jgi:hypothetical protein